MTRIVDSGNTLVPSYVCLVARGYNVERSESTDQGRLVETWIATKPGIELVADDPIRLLGLAAMLDSRGREWRATDSQIGDFLERFKVDV